MHSHDIAADGLRAEGIAPSIQAPISTSVPAPDRARSRAGSRSPGSARRCAAPIEIVGSRDRRQFPEIARAAKFLEIGAAFRRVVAVEGREGQVIDVGMMPKPSTSIRNAVPNSGEASRIGSRRSSSASRIAVGEDPLQAEERDALAGSAGGASGAGRDRLSVAASGARRLGLLR